MFYVYILTNKARTVLYTGHTDCLTSRMTQHIEKTHRGFTEKYNCDLLLWYELHETRDRAFERERQIKKWDRQWKENLIDDFNSQRADLFPGLTMDDLYNPLRIYKPKRDPRLRGDERNLNFKYR